MKPHPFILYLGIISIFIINYTIGSLSDDIVFGVHSNFQVVLKQMGKRDTTTKLKVCLCDV